MTKAPKRTAARLAALLAIAQLAGCATTDREPAGIAHVVLVWQKEPGDAAVRQLLLDTAAAFAEQIPELLSVRSGTALPSERSFHDDSFDVAFVMMFADRAALAAYEVHPVHQAAITDVLAPNVARLVVYDVELR